MTRSILILYGYTCAQVYTNWQYTRVFPMTLSQAKTSRKHFVIWSMMLEYQIP
jgi:hypothetical protein